MTTDTTEIKALLAPINDFDDFARQVVAGCIDIARRERARAEAAEAEIARLREQVTTLAAELERLHVGLSKLQDGMPDYLDGYVQALIDNTQDDDDD